MKERKRNRRNRRNRARARKCGDSLASSVAGDWPKPVGRESRKRHLRVRDAREHLFDILGSGYVESQTHRFTCPDSFAPLTPSHVETATPQSKALPYVLPQSSKEAQAEGLSCRVQYAAAWAAIVFAIAVEMNEDLGSKLIGRVASCGLSRGRQMRVSRPKQTQLLSAGLHPKVLNFVPKTPQALSQCIRQSTSSQSGYPTSTIKTLEKNLKDPL